MRDVASKLLRYALAGGAAAVVDIGGFSFLHSVHVSSALAAACSFGAATVVNFGLACRWAFGTRPSVLTYALFLSGALLGLFINVSVTLAGVAWFDLKPPVAKTIAVAATFLVNFVINNSVVFRSQSVGSGFASSGRPRG
jgi:putative flippase GtrA